MLLFPAIDLMDGEVVRLEQGDAHRKTVYSKDPAAMARKWEVAGGDWLHVVDLNAAFTGVSHNLREFAAITEAVSIPCEIGGGMRDAKAIQSAFDAGAARVVIGSRAAGGIDFVSEMCREFGGDRIAVGIDARNGRVATDGWTKTSEITAKDLAQRVADVGVETIIYTDISTDGMLKGPNLQAMRAMTEWVSCDVIASGGVSCAQDIQSLAKIPNLYGAIMGRALYEDCLPDDLTSILKNGRI